MEGVKVFPIEQETYDLIYDLIKEVRDKCLLPDDGSLYVRNRNNGVEDMYNKVQHELWKFCVKHNDECKKEEA